MARKRLLLNGVPDHGPMRSYRMYNVQSEFALTGATFSTNHASWSGGSM